MSKYFTLCILSGLLLVATGASAQHWRRFTDDRFEPRYYHYNRHYDDHKVTGDKKAGAAEKGRDYDVLYYRYDNAWRKNMKSEKKAYKARERYDDYRPVSAERKMYKAEKKAWKSHMKEHERQHWHYRDDPHWDR